MSTDNSDPQKRPEYGEQPGYVPPDHGASNDADPTAWQRPAGQGSSNQYAPPNPQHTHAGWQQQGSQQQQAWQQQGQYAGPQTGGAQPWQQQAPPGQPSHPGWQQPQSHLAQTPWHLSPEKQLNDLRDDAQLAAIIGGGSWFIGLPFIGGPIGLYMATKLRRQFIDLGVAPTTSVTVAWWIGLLTTIFTLVLPFIGGILLLVLLLVGVFTL